MLGDSGPLSKFAIEVLDNGFRAVNPAVRTRYEVRRAPDDEPLTNPAELRPSSAPSSDESPFSDRNAATVPAPASQKSAASVTVPDDVVPPAPPAPEQRASQPPAGRASTPPRDASVAGTGSSASQAVSAPSVRIRSRLEEPSAQSPIVYYEAAYAVAEGLSREAVERVLLFRFREVCSELESRPSGKYVQLAIFDHEFDRRPLRAPLATLSWKDWRGGPSVAFTGFEEAAPSAPASVPPRTTEWQSAPSSAAVAEAAQRPASVPPPASPPSSAPSSMSPSSPPRKVPSSIPPSNDAVRVMPSVPVGPAPSSNEVSVPKQTALPVIAEAEPQAQAAAAAETPAAPPSVGPVDAAPQQAAAASAATLPAERSAARASKARPEPAAVRRAGEELIGELFEQMHELHFIRDLADGSDFVLQVLRSVLPSEAIVIHVFDINTRNFVVVRAYPRINDALLLCTPDDHPFVQQVMRGPVCMRFDDAASEQGFSSQLWHVLGVEPKRAMIGAVRHGGRYLGMIQLVNPSGGAPFHDTEANALEYICKQFADFIAARPVVLEADTVIPPA